MKKRIFNYDQVKLVNAGLDIEELMILDYIAHFKNSGKMEEHIKDDKCWNWISWSKIANDLPFLRLKKEAIQRKCLYYLGIKPSNWEERVSAMTESSKKKTKTYKFLGLIEFNTIGDLGEERTIFRFTDKWYKLIEEDGESEHKKVDTLPQAPTKESKKDYLNKSISQNTKKYTSKNIPTVKTRFHNINESFSKYSPEQLEEILLESQKDKFKNEWD